MNPAPSTRHPFAVSDLVGLNRLQDPQLSPDGKSVVFALRENDVDANRSATALWWLDLDAADARPRRLTPAGGHDSTARWAPDGRRLYFLSRRSGTSQVWVLERDWAEARAVTALALEVTSFRVSPDGQRLVLSMEVLPAHPDPEATQRQLQEQAERKGDGRLYERLFVRHWDQWRDQRRAQLFMAEVPADGAIRKVRALTPGLDADVPSKPFGDDADYVFSADGRSLFFAARIAGQTEAWSTNFDVYQLDVESGGLRNLTADNPAWDGYPLAAADGRRLFYLAMRHPGNEADRFAILEKSLGDGEGRAVAPDWDCSAGPLKLSADGKTLFTTADEDGQHPLFAVDVATGTVRRLIDTGHVAGFSVAGGRIVVALDTLTAPTDLFELDMGSGALRRLTDVNAEALAGVRFGAVHPFYFAGWNNERVRGYVVEPAGRVAGRKYPVAFLIHGGPQGSWINDFHYRWNPQVYAGAGFAVVVVDFHGSTGYGQAFTDSITGDWGGKPLEDLQKGWAAAIAEFDWLDAGRAAALGASYGGYMVNWMAGHWKEPWRCLVSHCGVFDQRTMYYSTDELWFDEWGHQTLPWENPEEFERFNPVAAVGRWSVPMLVIHGANDFRIPMEQGLAAFTALQRRGIPSQFLYFPSESHWVSSPHNSLQWHDCVLEWLQRWTGEIPAAS